MKCPFPACGKRVMSKGLCSGHYHQQHKGQPLRPLTPQEPPGPCTFPGCGRPRFARRVCVGHYRQVAAGQEMKPLLPRRGGRKARARESWA
jgi:hypothetical protein